MKIFIQVLLFSVCISSCIKDDILADVIPASVRIVSSVDTLAKDSTFLLEAVYFNTGGKKEEVALEWTSSNSSVLSINSNGLISGQTFGTSEVTVSFGEISTSKTIVVDSTTSAQSLMKGGQVNTTSSYALFGNFTVDQVGTDLNMNFFSDYNASTALPGLYVYLTNNPNSNSGALEIGPVTTFSGAHSYTIPNVGINDYTYVLYFCKPFNVKVGHGAIN